VQPSRRRRERNGTIMNAEGKRTRPLPLRAGVSMRSVVGADRPPLILDDIGAR
jgi:hypothetical protein